MKIETTALGEALRLWRGADLDNPAERLTAQEASDILGIPKRTLDGIEQGRPFRYEVLLLKAIEAQSTERQKQRIIGRKLAKQQKRLVKTRALPVEDDDHEACPA